MSRIGRKPIALPAGVNVKIEGRNVMVKGPKGSLSWEHPERISVTLAEGVLSVGRADDTKQVRSWHGLSRSLIDNMVTGVSAGYQKVMEIVGVGLRAQAQGDKLNMSLGFSHPVEFALPEGITAEVDKKQTTITLNGIDKQQLGQTVADLRKLRPPDAYKGKGIRNAGEVIKLKAGKSSKK